MDAALLARKSSTAFTIPTPSSVLFRKSPKASPLLENRTDLIGSPRILTYLLPTGRYFETWVKSVVAQNPHAILGCAIRVQAVALNTHKVQ